MSTALSRGGIPQLSWAGVPGLTSPPQKPSISPVIQLVPPGGVVLPLMLDLQFLRLLPLVNKDFAGGSSSCVNFCSSQLEMPLPLGRALPSSLPPSALPLAFFP